ncbi:hypothetical protein COU54_00065 [Candidatus Pacearchaeota archaeon CG10_big_fil_rev_8_21_14_0_10_31_24]|nr:MAG: hypothetical protein COU54_00065 [Candidatus Pacearchaeota archaeon CG10_big_fil_rev_8_21_14_0_10_31_24]
MSKTDFIKSLKQYAETIPINPGLMVSGKTANKARAERERIGIDSLLNDNRANGSPSYSNISQIQALTLEQREAESKEAFEHRENTSYAEAVMTFEKNPNAILKDGKKWAKELSTLVDKEFLELGKKVGMVNENDAKFLDSYLHYSELDKIVNAGKIPDGLKDDDNLRKIASQGMIQREIAHLRSKGYDEKAVESGARLASLVSQYNPDEKLMIEGLIRQRDMVKKALEKESKNDIDGRASEAVANTITKAMESQDRRIIGDYALNYLYKAYSGTNTRYTDLKLKI